MPMWNRWEWGWHSSQFHSGSARGGWVRRGSSSTNHAFSGHRGATRVIKRFGVSLTRATTLSTRWKERIRVEIVPGVTEGVFEDGLGIRKQYRGSLALRCVAYKSRVGEPQVRSRSLAT